MAIPNHAECVFKGISFDVYHWPQEMFDGSVMTFEALLQSPSVDVIVITPDNKILVLSENQPSRPPFVGLVAGSCEEGEEALDTAKRELLEEVGMVSEDWSLFGTYGGPSRIENANHLYIARGCKKAIDQKLDAGENISFREVEWKEFLDVVADPTFRFTKFALDVLRCLYLGQEAELKKRIFGE